MNSLETLYSPKEAGKKLGGISHYTILKWAKDGTLRPTRLGKRLVMISESELRRFIESAQEAA